MTSTALRCALAAAVSNVQQQCKSQRADIFSSFYFFVFGGGGGVRVGVGVGLRV